MRYCKKCTMPDTRPGITFDAEGVCSACRHYESRKNVDWDARFKEFEAYCNKYRGMNGPGGYDCAVAVSGGKDSVALTIGLSMLRKYIGFDYEVVAVTLDPQFGGRPMDYTVLQELFAQYDIPYEIRRTEIGPVVFDYRKEKNPCALCAKLRRGSLHTALTERGIHKIALGHHYDDAVETLLMNLLFEGRIGCFQPVTYLDRTGIDRKSVV